MGGRFELGGCSQEWLGFRTIGAGEHQAEIKVGLEDVRLGSDRLTIRVNGFIAPADTVVDESEVEPCLIVFGIALKRLFQERLGGSEIIFLDSLFGSGYFGRLVVADVV